MKQIKIILDIRTEDIDGNDIKVKTTLRYILKALNKIWNIEAYNITNMNGTENKLVSEIFDEDTINM